MRKFPWMLVITGAAIFLFRKPLMKMVSPLISKLTGKNADASAPNG